MVARQLDDETEIDRIFHALADATRRDILRRTLDAEISISEVAAAYDMSFAAVQKHISVLGDAGLVTKRAVGRTRLVRGNPDGFGRARALLDRYDNIWRARIGRLDSVLAGD